MAKNVSVVVTDDLDGSESAETVPFGFDGVAYEIDLAKKNRAKRGSSVDRSVVRTWAKTAGLKVSERGRISTDIMGQYEAAH